MTPEWALAAGLTRQQAGRAGKASILSTIRRLNQFPDPHTAADGNFFTHKRVFSTAWQVAMLPGRDRMGFMRFHTRKRLAVCGLLLTTALLGGCEKALFVENEPRTPYERYMALRGRTPMMTEENPYGGKSPALRDRLKPLDAQ